jgi:hypothetical protein
VRLTASRIGKWERSERSGIFWGIKRSGKAMRTNGAKCIDDVVVVWGVLVGEQASRDVVSEFTRSFGFKKSAVCNFILDLVTRSSI